MPGADASSVFTADARLRASIQRCTWRQREMAHGAPHRRGGGSTLFPALTPRRTSRLARWTLDLATRDASVRPNSPGEQVNARFSHVNPGARERLSSALPSAPFNSDSLLYGVHAPGLRDPDVTATISRVSRCSHAFASNRQQCAPDSPEFQPCRACRGRPRHDIGLREGRPHNPLYTRSRIFPAIAASDKRDARRGADGDPLGRCCYPAPHE